MAPLTCAGRALRFGPPLAAAAALAHLAPAATWLPPVRARFPELAGRGRAGHVALTFDDGPHAEATPRMLDALERLDVRATFFLLGDRVAALPDMAARIAAAGHEVATHGWDHRAPVRPWRDRADLRRALTALAEVTGVQAAWYRPPYGVLTTTRLAAARALRLRPVLWTAWGRDWRRRATPTSITAEILTAADGGGTLLLHGSDAASPPGSWHATLAAVPEIVTGLRDRGLTIGPLRDHGVSPT